MARWAGPQPFGTRAPHPSARARARADTRVCANPAPRQATGAALGAALRAVVDAAKDTAGAGHDAKRQKTATGGGASAPVVFCCPLDEAFCESTLVLSPADGVAPGCQLLLAPYGTMPPQGRTWIGCYRCTLTELFWSAVATELGAALTLKKIRGDNAHHVVESTFKAFARSFRAALDHVTYGGNHGLVGAAEDRVAARAPGGAHEGVTYLTPEPSPIYTSARSAARSRSTKETVIDVKVDLDHASTKLGSTPTKEGALKTGVVALSHLLSVLEESCGFSFDVQCQGDTYIDDHHSSEDLGISLGQALLQAFGNKAGLTRMGCAESACGNAQVRVVMDLSNRPSFESDIALDEEYVGGQRAYDELAKAAGKGARCGVHLTCEMFHHVIESLTVEMRATVHVVAIKDTATPGHTMDLAVATVTAYGKALAECLRLDPRRAGKVASSKGTLSV